MSKDHNLWEDPGDGAGLVRSRQSTKHRSRRWVVIVFTAAVIGALASRVATYSDAPVAKRQAKQVASVPSLYPAASASSQTIGSNAASSSQASVLNGSFTTLGGHQMDLATFRGKPVMLWFIVVGCASCSVSVPAVAKRLPTFVSDHIEIISLDLYGDLPRTSQAKTEMTQFAQVAAGPAFPSSHWIWGFASKALSEAYDPSGIPDLYYLVSSTGQIIYKNSVPVSTMPQLLAHAKAAAVSVP